VTIPQQSPPSLKLQFPNFPETIDLSHLSVIIQDLSVTYDVTAVATLPNYGYVQMPAYQLGPRRWSILYKEDRIQVEKIRLASPLLLILGAIGVGGPRILKSWAGVLSAGQNIYERAQVIRENRALAPHRERAAKLDNELIEQKLRIARAQADIAEKTRDKILANEPDRVTDNQPDRVPTNQQDRVPTEIRRSSRANSLEAEEFTILLDAPIRRILEYGGGELQITPDSDD
jgi:hypothetical protein